jgi:hypothetical protein
LVTSLETGVRASREIETERITTSLDLDVDLLRSTDEVVIRVDVLTTGDGNIGLWGRE